jgi:hypothetical protein
VPDAFTAAHTVFAGRCISGTLLTKNTKDVKAFDQCQFTFRVTRTWKGGSDTKEVTVETGVGGGDCGYSFSIGESYILYCYEDSGTLKTHICTRTSVAEFEPHMDPQIKVLDEMKAMTK